ncbi:sarcoplasmic reticulum histidine-rich calcium-binding protein-like [Helicoverpa armigera]|uniref:sarcoplasmic reticulum histidine-rich calcium-binding protein-like n=1 Tax=Helicoverpa armigera TaxID=29058 RepID=UPI0030838B3D
MIRKTIILLSLALCVLGDGHHAVSEQHIKINHKEHHGHHGELTHIGSKKPEHHEEYAWSYPSYEFSYSVHDPHTHDKKGQHESRDGDEVKGEYWLIEPDGRKRTVTYHADKHSGFHAIVHYSDHHHHIVEHHGHVKDDHKDDDHKDDDHKDHKEEEHKHDDHSKEEHKDHDDHKDSHEDESEEHRGAEETRGREGGVIRWGYGPKWDHDKDDHRRGHDDHKRGHDDDRDDDDDKYDIGKMTIYGRLGSYGSRRDDKKRDEKRDHDKKEEESLLWEERRKFDERRGYPSIKTPYFGHPSRMNPRFYRHNQRDRNISRRT